SRFLAAEDGSGNKQDAAAADDAEDDVAALEEGPQILGAEPVASKKPDDDDDDGTGKKGAIAGGVPVGGYGEWLRTEGKKYKKMIPGRTNYFGGGARPFPLNPAFRPRAPLSDATREAIYTDYLGDPVRATPRVLGEKYGISIKRVEAVIKLKAIEHHAVANDGFTAQKKLAAGMESMLGLAQNAPVVKENLVSQRTRVSGPRFHAVPEGEPFHAADAAEVLGRRPYQEIMDRLAASKPYIVDYEGLDPAFAPRPEKKLSRSEEKRLESLGSAHDEVIEKNDALTSHRWRFVFTDVSKNMDMKDRFVLIREKDGTLKKANRDYKLKRYGQMWFK
ncbi:hypothetical protein LPJ61_002490, partial [Coemansia biformis]